MPEQDEGLVTTKRILLAFAAVIVALTAMRILGLGEPAQQKERNRSSEPVSRQNVVDVNADVSYEETDFGRSFVGSYRVVNRTAENLNVYAFIYAEESEVSPLARGIFPAKALQGMGSRRIFQIKDPTLGHELHIAPNDTATFEAGIRVPTERHAGEPIDVSSFAEADLYLYEEAGNRLYEKSWSFR